MTPSKIIAISAFSTSLVILGLILVSPLFTAYGQIEATLIAETNAVISTSIIASETSLSVQSTYNANTHINRVAIQTLLASTDPAIAQAHLTMWAVETEIISTQKSELLPPTQTRSGPPSPTPETTHLSDTPTQNPLTPVPTARTEVPVVVALRDIPRGFRFTEDSLIGDNPVLGYEFWHVDYVPLNSMDSMDSALYLSGGTLYARVFIPKGVPLLSTHLADDPLAMSRVGSNTALEILPGYVALLLEKEYIRTAPPDLAYNDWIDIMGVFNLGEGGTITCMLVQTLKVIAVTDDSVVVATERQQALILTWAQDNNLPIIVLRIDPTVPNNQNRIGC